MGEKPNQADELAGEEGVERSGGSMSSIQNMKARTAGDSGPEPEPTEASNLNQSKSNREGQGDQGQETRRIAEEAKEGPGPAEPGPDPASPGGPGPATGGGP